MPNLLRSLSDSVSAAVYLRRIAKAQERQAVAAEQLVILVAKATGQDSGLRTFYEDRRGSEAAELMTATDEELADIWEGRKERGEVR